MATKRLNDLFETRKASSQDKSSGARNDKGKSDHDQVNTICSCSNSGRNKCTMIFYVRV